MSEAESPTERIPVLQQIQEMEWNFWVCNGIEACERLAFFGVRAVLPIYMINAEAGGIGLSYFEKGVIYFVWALIQCLLPMVSGGYTDAFGYRKSMYVAFTINIGGYCLMANASNFWLMLAAACLVGTGTAIFKPPVQGSVAASLNPGNSGLGFGIFYWMVNVGGLLAPILASAIRGNDLNPTWNHVFYGAAIVTAINFLPATFLFREPKRSEDAKKTEIEPQRRNPWFLLFLEMVTLGLYRIIWYFRTARKLKQLGAEIPSAWLMFVPIVNLWWLWRFAAGVDKGTSGRVGTIGAFFVLLFAGVAGGPVVLWLLNKHAPEPVDYFSSGEQVFTDTMITLWRDQPMLRFLLVVSGFWFMFMQLWDLLPNFIDEWVDARDAGAFIAQSGIADKLLNVDGGIKPEMLINIDAATIILLVFPLSWFFGKYKMIVSLLLGMVIATVGFIGAGMFQAGAIVALMIFIFAIGEIICSPKFTEYVGMTAPPDKKAIYMGYSNIPFAIGWAVGGIVSNPLYGKISSKEMLARRYLVDEGGMTAEAVEKLQATQVMPALMSHLGSADSYEATAVLWNAYNPWVIWPILSVIGIISIAGMWWFYRSSMRDKPA